MGGWLVSCTHNLTRLNAVSSSLVPFLQKQGAEDSKSQHVGFGRQLMSHCELMAARNGYSKVAVISGVGVRDFYRKLGYVWGYRSIHRNFKHKFVGQVCTNKFVPTSL